MERMDDMREASADAMDCPDELKPDLIDCDPYAPFRQVTAKCNNLRNPMLGASDTPFGRVLPHRYDDGVSKPRERSVTGGRLPSGRVVSNAFMELEKPDKAHRVVTTTFTFFGTFIDHDVTKGKRSGKTQFV